MAGQDRNEESAAADGTTAALIKLIPGGAALVAVGALMRLAEHDSGMRTVGAVTAGLGAAAILVGLIFRPPREHARGYTDSGEAHDPERKVRLGVAGASALLTAVGLFLLVQDALSLEAPGTAWPFLVSGAVGLVASGIWHAVASPQPRDVVVAPPASPRHRAWIAAGVGVLLVLEALTPLRYYLGDDIFDERFSWRMFSAVRVYRCELTAFESRAGRELPTNLMSTVQVGWITTMRRSREDVLRGYLRWRCEQDDVEAARVVNRCRTPEGNTVPDVVREIDCSTGTLSEGDAPEVRVHVEGAQP
ncbi:MAG: hypothetical protein AB8I08_15090 [Sandaracinaceae bacterium]